MGICCGRNGWLSKSRSELPSQKRGCLFGELMWFFERQHVAAVFEDFESRSGNFLCVELAHVKREELVVPAPEEERGAFDAAEVLEIGRAHV